MRMRKIPVWRRQILALVFPPPETPRWIRFLEPSVIEINLSHKLGTPSLPVCRILTFWTQSLLTLQLENCAPVIYPEVWMSLVTVTISTLKGSDPVMKAWNICQILVSQHCQTASVMRYSMNSKKQPHSTNTQTGARTTITNLRTFIKIFEIRKRGTQGSVLLLQEFDNFCISLPLTEIGSDAWNFSLTSSGQILDFSFSVSLSICFVFLWLLLIILIWPSPPQPVLIFVSVLGLCYTTLTRSYTQGNQPLPSACLFVSADI